MDGQATGVAGLSAGCDVTSMGRVKLNVATSRGVEDSP